MNIFQKLMKVLLKKINLKIEKQYLMKPQIHTIVLERTEVPATIEKKRDTKTVIKA